MSLLSRYAENLFWLARYTERAASLARIIEVHTTFGRGRQRSDSWSWIAALYSDEERFRARYATESVDNITYYYLKDPENPGSVLSSLRSARENARSLRPLISTSMWSQLNEFYNRALNIGAAELSEARLQRTCDMILHGCYAQVGVADSTLYQDEGWRLYRLGLAIERADQTSRLLDVRFAQLATGAAREDHEAGFVFWTTLLRSAAAHQAFRRVEPRGADRERVARFLIFNACFPRSLAASFGQMEALLNELRSGFGLTGTSLPLEHMEIMLSGLQAASRDPQLTHRLHTFNDWVQRCLMTLTEDFSRTFFGAVPVAGDPSDTASQSQGSAPAGQSQVQSWTAS